jgi:hypothetical protein
MSVAGGARVDVREFLKTLPVTRNPLTGYDCTEGEWFYSARAYPLYVRAAALIRPTSVLEIGAFLGFGLASFLYGTDTIARLTVVDNEFYMAGSLQACSDNLASFQGEKRFLRSLEEARGEYDLIHVDGDHTFAGALHEMAFAWGLGPRVMLVNDYTFLEDVRRATDAFATRQALPFKVWRSYRGWAVFARPDTFTALPDAL